MSISFECKNCGGELEIIEEGVGRCTSCRTKQPIPKRFDEKYNRANKFRRENANFDEAARLYDSIIDENPDEAEAYWGRVLCRYGIEEVKDRDGDYKPTCHRTIEKSIMEDADFKLACEHADNAQNLEYYQQQAEIIDTIQRKILRIVKNEEPYDIFISFKDKDDETRAETEDSKAANVLYNELVLMGYKVFFSKVTLRDKLGEDYEPYIYAALKSSKVMILVGTKKEYMQAKWVRNEWRRFNDMRLNGDRKKIIVAIKDMSEDDVPYELNTMQFAKLDSMTFLEDIKKNIDNFLGEAIEVRKEREAQKQMEKFMSERGVITDNDKALSWYESASAMLKQGRFKEAINDFGEAIKTNPRYADAFWGRLLAKHGIRNEELLSGMTLDIGEDEDYVRAYNFASGEEQRKYASYLQACRENSNIESEYVQVMAQLERKYCDKQTPERTAAGDKISKLWNKYVKYESAYEELKEYSSKTILVQVVFWAFMVVWALINGNNNSEISGVWAIGFIIIPILLTYYEIKILHSMKDYSSFIEKLITVIMVISYFMVLTWFFMGFILFFVARKRIKKIERLKQNYEKGRQEYIQFIDNEKNAFHAETEKIFKYYSDRINNKGFSLDKYQYESVNAFDSERKELYKLSDGRAF